MTEDMETIYRVRRALRRAVDEHGAPNSFSPSELHTLYGGPRPLDAGRGARVSGAAPCVGGGGIVRFRYEDRRFAVEPHE